MIDWTGIAALATLAGAVATAAGAFATIISAGIIAVQAYYTRRSVRDAETALVLAQQQFARDAHIFNEAQKARIDAEMPRLLVAASLDYSVSYEQDSRPVEPGTRFTQSQQYTPLRVTFNVSVINESTRQLHLDVLAMNGETMSKNPVVLAAGRDNVFPVVVQRTVTEWIQQAVDWNASRRNSVWPADELACRIQYILPADFGANEQHDIVIAGSVLSRVPENDHEWQIATPQRADYGHMLIEAKPYTRKYWRSRQNSDAFD